MEIQTYLTEKQVRNVVRYRKNPSDFSKEVLGLNLEPYQDDALQSISINRKTAWRAGHGVGKTTTAACAALWFFSLFYQSKVITTASAWRQVEKQLWPEIHHWGRRAKWDLIGLSPNQIEWLTLQIRRKDYPEWFITGEASDDAAKMEGFHAPNLFYIMDEGKSISYDTYEAVEGAFTNAQGTVRQLVISTPPVGTDNYFSEIFKKKRLGFNCLHTSGLESKRVSKEWVEERAKEWGETSNIFRTRVMGEIVEDSEDTLIPLKYIEAAHDRYESTPWESPIEMGVDVARFGSDETIIAIRKGKKVLPLKRFIKEDTMETVGHVIAEKRLHDPKSIKVDVVGVGGGVVDRLNEEEYEVVPINVGESAYDSEKFANLRAELFWGLRERFVAGDIALPPDDELDGQLSNIKYTFTSRGQIKIEEKDAMKKRGLKSPDKADAIMLAFAVDTKPQPDLYIP